jgi:hypothetical protein
MWCIEVLKNGPVEPFNSDFWWILLRQFRETFDSNDVVDQITPTELDIERTVRVDFC